MENIIEVKNVCKNYPAFKLDDVSFKVPGGAIVGFVGENGAGKTTTIKAILSVVKKDAGEILIFGKDSGADGETVRQDIGVVFDECCFHDWMRANQVGKVLKGVYKNWDDAYYIELLQRFGLGKLTEKKDTIGTYSRGMKMKLSLAAALAHHPKLLILDEATSGLDPIVRDEILDLFMEFIKDEDHSILFSSHITSDIEKAADYLVFIHQGKIVMDAEKDVLLDEHAVVRCTNAAYEAMDKTHVKGVRKGDFGVNLLIDNRADFKPAEDMIVDKATVDDIMLFTVRGKQNKGETRNEGNAD